jgi:hypothetical protein
MDGIFLGPLKVLELELELELDQRRVLNTTIHLSRFRGLVLSHSIALSSFLSRVTTAICAIHNSRRISPLIVIKVPMLCLVVIKDALNHWKMEGKKE